MYRWVDDRKQIIELKQQSISGDDVPNNKILLSL